MLLPAGLFKWATTPADLTPMAALPGCAYLTAVRCHCLMLQAFMGTLGHEYYLRLDGVRQIQHWGGSLVAWAAWRPAGLKDLQPGCPQVHAAAAAWRGVLVQWATGVRGTPALSTCCRR